MLSEFRRRKVSAGFKGMDVDGDGLLGSDDIELLIKNHGSAYGYLEDTEEYEDLARSTMAVWEQLKQFDSDGDGLVSLDEYVNGFDELLSRRDAFMANMTAVVDAFFAVADRNMDGQITEDELILHFRAWGNSVAQAKVAFKRLDRDKNGAISKAEWMANLEEYYFSEDAEAPGNWLPPLPD